MWNKVYGCLDGKVNSVKKLFSPKFAALGAAGGMALSNVASAADGFTMPTMPLDFAEIATAGLIIVGVVIGAIAGAVIVVRLCKMGLAWISNAFAGKAG